MVSTFLFHNLFDNYSDNLSLILTWLSNGNEEKLLVRRLEKNNFKVVLLVSWSRLKFGVGCIWKSVPWDGTSGKCIYNVWGLLGNLKYPW